MSARVSVDVRALFADMGIECESAATDLVIDRFGQWADDVSADVSPIRASVCRFDVLEAA
ncbi:hypothetical protein ACWED2_07335 [Amycolatopsis sp. NPDC005003]